MHILLTNDDGYSAPGIAAAYKAVCEMGEVYVVAPATEKSACSHGISLHGPINVEVIDHPDFGRTHAVHGTPADCVRLAVGELIGITFDLVVSGINRGANTGVDTFYSGTVAGAREAAIHGMTSIALSSAVRQSTQIEWDAVSDLSKSLVTNLLKEKLPGRGFWNVNMPTNLPADPLNHVHRVPIAGETVPISFLRDNHPDTDVIQFQYHDSYWERPVQTASDFTVVRDGGIAITAVPLFGRF